MYSDHDTPKKTNDEFTAVYADAQSRQFRVVTSTPILSQMRDDEVVIYSSGTVSIMFRVGQEIYAVNGSCVTVRR